MITELRNVKIRVNSREESELFQQIAFVCGCKWPLDGCVERCTEEPFLYIDSKGLFTFDSIESKGNFNGHHFKEITLKQLTPPKNADLMALQAKGVGFLYDGATDAWSFAGKSSLYEVDLSSCFEPVKDEKQDEIDAIEKEMRILADRLEALKN